jgi:hypothetical protein
LAKRPIGRLAFALAGQPEDRGAGFGLMAAFEDGHADIAGAAAEEGGLFTFRVELRLGSEGGGEEGEEEEVEEALRRAAAAAAGAAGGVEGALRGARSRVVVAALRDQAAIGAGRSTDRASLINAFVNGFIVVLVANVPEGLPATVVSCLTISAKRMAGVHVFIKKADIIEALGAATVIASDKTGTLTQNRMTVSKTWQAGAPARAQAGGGALLIRSLSVFNAPTKQRLDITQVVHIQRQASSRRAALPPPPCWRRPRGSGGSLRRAIGHGRVAEVVMIVDHGRQGARNQPLMQRVHF